MTTTLVNTEVQSVPTTVTDAHLVAALTQDDSGLFAVYLAIVIIDWTSHRDAHQVRASAGAWAMAHGAKLSHRDARSYFRGLSEIEYRR